MDDSAIDAQMEDDDGTGAAVKATLTSENRGSMKDMFADGNEEEEEEAEQDNGNSVMNKYVGDHSPSPGHWLLTTDHRLSIIDHTPPQPAIPSPATPVTRHPPGTRSGKSTSGRRKRPDRRSYRYQRRWR